MCTSATFHDICRIRYSAMDVPRTSSVSHNLFEVRSYEALCIVDNVQQETQWNRPCECCGLDRLREKGRRPRGCGLAQASLANGLARCGPMHGANAASCGNEERPRESTDTEMPSSGPSSPNPRRAGRVSNVSTLHQVTGFGKTR